MRVLRVLAILVVLAVPPAVLTVAVWPDNEADADDGATGEPFADPVNDTHTATIELDGVAWGVTLRPDASGACLEVMGPTGGGGSCEPLDSMEYSGGITTASSGPGGNEIEVSGLVDPSVEAVELHLDDAVIEGVVEEIDGRPEKVFLVRASFGGDPFGGGAVGGTLRLLDGDGEVLDEHDV